VKKTVKVAHFVIPRGSSSDTAGGAALVSVPATEIRHHLPWHTHDRRHKLTPITDEG
jgi:hypothetical protein